VSAPRWSLWQLQRSDGRGLEVDAGPEARITAAAAARNETARAHGLAGTVFVALPSGRKPMPGDLPPAPQEPAPEPSAAERTVAGVTDDLIRLAAVGTSPGSSAHGAVAHRVRQLTQEACSLAVRDTEARYRRSLGRAWGAWLDLMMSVKLPEAGGRSLLQDVLDLEPELRQRFEAEFLKGSKRS
jgi:hypothetical protein